jgi:hypothetical protein
MVVANPMFGNMGGVKSFKEFGKDIGNSITKARQSMKESDAMEFIKEYKWKILVVLAAIAVLSIAFYFISKKAKSLNKKSHFGNEFHKVKDTTGTQNIKNALNTKPAEGYVAVPSGKVPAYIPRIDQLAADARANDRKKSAEGFRVQGNQHQGSVNCQTVSQSVCNNVKREGMNASASAIAGLRSDVVDNTVKPSARLLRANTGKAGPRAIGLKSDPFKNVPKSVSGGGCLASVKPKGSPPGPSGLRSGPNCDVINIPSVTSYYGAKIQ